MSSPLLSLIFIIGRTRLGLGGLLRLVRGWTKWTLDEKFRPKKNERGQNRANHSSSIQERKSLLPTPDVRMSENEINSFPEFHSARSRGEPELSFNAATVPKQTTAVTSYQFLDSLTTKIAPE